MPINRNAYIRYQALDRCFRNRGRRYFIEDLVEACCEALQDFGGELQGVKRRQVLDDIRFMESEQGWAVPLARHQDGRRVYYRYEDLDFSIGNRSLNELDESQLREALNMLASFKGRPQLEWLEPLLVKLQGSFADSESLTHVVFGGNAYLAGMEHFGPLLQAIQGKSSICVRYRSFKDEESVFESVSPYQLREYNNRWFLVGKVLGIDWISIFPLDRIVNLEEVCSTGYEASSWDLQDYFEDIVGVSRDRDAIVEQVNLRVAAKLWPYLETKPIHGSQKKRPSQIEGWIEVELSVIPNFELEQVLLSYGEEVVVTGPCSFVARIRKRISGMASGYI